MDDLFDLDILWDAVLHELTDRADDPARSPARARFGADLVPLGAAAKARVLVDGDLGVATDARPGSALTPDAHNAQGQHREAGRH